MGNGFRLKCPLAARRDKRAVLTRQDVAPAHTADLDFDGGNNEKADQDLAWLMQSGRIPREPRARGINESKIPAAPPVGQDSVQINTSVDGILLLGWKELFAGDHHKHGARQTRPRCAVAPWRVRPNSNNRQAH